MNAITVKNLCFSYGSHPVLDHINAEIPEGKLSAILGRNGSGKSTLLRIMAGQLQPEQGTTEVMGQQTNRNTARQNARLIGFMPQFHHAVFPFTVLDVVLTGRYSHTTFLPAQTDIDAASEALEMTGISGLQHRNYSELSGGEQQMVMIARVLAQQPKVILLDEPLSHLDIKNQLLLFALVNKLTKQGLSIIMVLHDPTSALLHADVLFCLKNGKISKLNPHGQVGELSSALSHAYDVQMEVLQYGGRMLAFPALPARE